MFDPDEIETLDDQLATLETALGGAGTVAQGFSAELRRIQQSFAETSREMAQLERGMSRGLRGAFDALILDGASLSEALHGLAQSISQTVYATAMKPVTDHFGSLLAQGIGAIVPFADGGAFASGRVTPFAKGGVVASPTHFALRGGMGLMGEAGPEAIMPLTRGADGRLGVQASGGSGATVVINVTTPDVAGFQRSRSQIAAQMGRALSRAQRIK